MEDLASAVAADEAAARFARGSQGSPLGFNLRNLAAGAYDDLADIGRAATAIGLGAAAYYATRPKSSDTAELAPEPVPDITRPPQAYRAPRPLVPDITSKPRPMSTADLAAETSPPPVVTAEEPVVFDYAQMARDKIRQANEIQLREGRITPESAALSREADALYQRAADERRAGNHPPIMPVEMQNEQTSAIRARQRRAG
jgi:hypothetical protein